MASTVEPIEGGGVTSAEGFSAGATFAGLKTYGQDKLDFGLLVSDRPCATAGMFTQSTIVSPSVTITRERVADGRAQAVVANSGCANACVGPQGLIDAKATTALAAAKLGLPEEDVLIASTGIIGVELPMSLVRLAVDKVETSDDGGTRFARAIMTTDSKPKEAAVSFEAGGKRCAIGAAAKGVGMIHPDMATHLSFIATDAAVEPGFLREALRDAVNRSFNMVTVDADTSTNDTVLLLANGAAGNEPIQAGTPEAAEFVAALDAVCVPLTKMIARDGEGATKLIEVTVERAASYDDARRAARTVASSALVKAAVHGADPNWGRVMMALGRSGALVDESKIALYMNEICVFDQGAPVPFFKEAAQVTMREDVVTVRADLDVGTAAATAWGCDLTEEYVRFNSEYTT